MHLSEAIRAAGMTPPKEIVSGRWLRFPGCGKGRTNRSGWCRVISPTLAIFGDWSTGLTETWRDETHRDTQQSARQLVEARRREQEFAAAQRRRQHEAAEAAAWIVSAAQPGTHPYLASKGFAEEQALVHEGSLIVPVRAIEDYRRVITVQRIEADGTKKFLSGGRARGGIYRIGPPERRHVALCEGYATGLSLREAFRRLPGPWTVVVCFSAGNLVEIARLFQRAIVCADNDASGTGEKAARATGLRWVMPREPGDFNDLHQRSGLHAVVEIVRSSA